MLLLFELQNSSYQEQVERLILKMNDMFKALRYGEMSMSDYDMAWVARVPSQHLDGSQMPYFLEAIKWILNNQLQDGLWGFPSHFLVCDHLLSTLNYVLALLVRNTSHLQIKQGELH